MTWFRLVKGLAEYRLGRYDSAVAWMQQVLSDAGAEFSRDASAWIVLAMVQHQLKQEDKARVSSAKGREIVDTRMAALDKGDLGEQWLDWITAHALMREAEALIQPTPKE